MASTLEFVTYVADQLALAGTITWKRMFGEYGLYCDQVFFGVICDDQLFIKITPPVAEKMPDCPKVSPYAGAKESFLIEDLDNREKLGQLIRMTCEHLSKPRKTKKKMECLPSKKQVR